MSAREFNLRLQPLGDLSFKLSSILFAFGLYIVQTFAGAFLWQPATAFDF
jgi:hypothetical protein